MPRILYIVPEDFDDVNEPNLFTMQAPVTMAGIRSNFPLKNADKYYFRLGVKHRTQMLWMDVKNDSMHLPPTDGDSDYYIKATRTTEAVAPPTPPPAKTAPQRPTERPNTEPKGSDMDSLLL